MEPANERQPFGETFFKSSTSGHKQRWHYEQYSEGTTLQKTHLHEA
jgi:hypothetical protein